jgi:hypothetical protein
MTWHKARAQPSQGVAGRPHHLGQPTMCWRISKNCFVYMSNRGGAQGIQCPKEVQGGNLATRPSCMANWPDMWAPCAQSSATTPPYSSYNTMVLPLVESVKRVRFNPLYCSQVHSCRVERERWGFEGRRTFRLVGCPRSSSSAEALLESVQVW